MPKIIKQKVVEEIPSTTYTAAVPKKNEYIVMARGGLYLRKEPPANTEVEGGMGAGAPIACMAYGDIFVEIERKGKWSYGTCNGKTGWACNVHLTEK